MSELRKDPATGRWIITGTRTESDFFDMLNNPKPIATEECFFCEGNEHLTLPEIYAVRNPGTARNGSGWQIRVVPSKSAVFTSDEQLVKIGYGIYDWMKNIGAHELIIETPQHIKNICDLSYDQITSILQVYKERMADLARDERFKYCLIFKNQRPESPIRYGHAHSQLVALPFIPKLIKDEFSAAREYFSYKERCVYCDIVRQEQKERKRIVEENGDYISFVPYAAKFAFELCIIPKNHNSDYSKESAVSIANLANILKISLQKISRVLNDPPLSYVLHTAPYPRLVHGSWLTIEKDYHWHIEIYPQVSEIMGFELGSGVHIQPLLPEICAKMLKEAK